LERISADARALPRLTPSRDLWNGIEARISGAQTRAHRRWFASPALRMAIAASLLIAATATITWQVASGRSDAALPQVAAADPGAPIPDLAPGDPGLSRPAGLREAAYDIDYSALDGEIRALQLVVDRNLARLDPKTVEVVEKNLALIDRAIEESRRALLQDPASAFLATELARAYTTKLSLLRNTAKLPAGT
jgi:hypothetical protein